MRSALILTRTLVAALLVATVPVHAQTSAEGRVRLPPAAYQTVQVPTDPAPASNSPKPIAPEVVVPTAYWRVTTRACGQNFGAICNCPLHVAACDACGCPRPSSEAEMIAALQPGVPVCIMVHGSFVDEESSRADSVGTYRWLRSAAPHRPLNVIFFDWPSDRSLGLLPTVQLMKLGAEAARNGFPIAQLVSHLPAESPVCLMGHSHGARAVVSATHLLAGGVVQGHRLGWVDRHHRLRLVLAAAAMDHNWLNPRQRYDRAVCRAECVVNLENRLDYALILYPLHKPFTARALGQSGLTRFDRAALGNMAGRVYSLDVTHLIGKEHIWPHYYCDVRIARSIENSVYFEHTQIAAR